jgi:hypothetical protein
MEMKMQVQPEEREYALVELNHLGAELQRWKMYRKVMMDELKRISLVDANSPHIDTYEHGIKEANEKIAYLAEVYEAQLVYCRKRGWIE